MDCSKMLAVLGAMATMVVATPVKAAVPASDATTTDGLVLTSGAQMDAQNVNWHSSHSSHSSHASHASHSSHSSSRW